VHRWAARKLGLAKGPVHVASDLTSEQIEAYRIADNQTATLSDSRAMQTVRTSTRHAQAGFGQAAGPSDRVCRRTYLGRNW
jgi:hypothetical protein